MVEIHNVEQGTDEWLEARIGKYTASNAIKLLKFGKTSKAVVQRSNFKGNYWTQRGHDLEPMAIEAYEIRKNIKVDRVGFVTNDKYPKCLFSPDGLTDKHVVEVKCFSEKKHLSIKRNNIPLEILAQIHFGMIMAEKKKAHLVLFNPDLKPSQALFIYDVIKNQALIHRLRILMRGKSS